LFLNGLISVTQPFLLYKNSETLKHLTSRHKKELVNQQPFSGLQCNDMDAKSFPSRSKRERYIRTEWQLVAGDQVMTQKAPIGYTDTPMLPNSKWRVHDANRPRPKVVTPGTCSTEDKPGLPPSDAIVLFDGKDMSKWISRTGGPVKWKVENGAMIVSPRAGDIQTIDDFGDCQLHIEWATPAEVKGDSQGRGNSGVFLMDRYEIQILDGYDNITYADGITAAIYGQYPPLVNACRKPGEWQTYDIFFLAPRFKGEELISPAFVTVIHNGVLVHHRQEIMGQTGHKILPSYKPHPARGPIRLQDHGNPVRFRNIWIRELKGYDEK